MSSSPTSNDAATTTETTSEAAKAADIIELEATPAEPPGPPPARAKAADDPAPLSLRGDLPPRVWPPKTLGDLMTRKLIAVEETEPLGDLEGGMKRFRFRHLPVVTGGTKLVGLITLSDFLHAVLGKAPDGSSTPPIDQFTPASTIMRRNVVTGKLDTPIATACKVMLQEKLSCLPVVLDDATLVGIVTETDFTKLALELLEKQ